MLWYLCICLTEIKADDTHPRVDIEKYSLITSYLACLACIKDKDGIWTRLAQLCRCY